MTRVSCGSNYMRIDLYRQYFNASRYETITLRDRACRASYSTGLITLGSVPKYCGGTRRETQKYIIYTNDVILTAKQNADMVTRDHDEIIQFSCRYDRNGYASGTSFLPISRISGNECKLNVIDITWCSRDIDINLCEFAFYLSRKYLFNKCNPTNLFSSYVTFSRSF